MNNSYDDEIVASLRGLFDPFEFRLINSSGILFSGLMESYPVLGSKIDWSRVEGAIERRLVDGGAVGFFKELRERFSLHGMMVYAGDGITEIAIESDIYNAEKILSVVEGIPQHHYLFGINFDWCMCVTMEGDMAFGFSKDHRRSDER